MTLCGGVPPLTEAVKIYDLLLAYGPHFSIIVVCAQYILMRENLLKSSSPMGLLRSPPPLDAKKLITMALMLVKILPDPLFDLIVRHTRDLRVYRGFSDLADEIEMTPTDGSVVSVEVDGHFLPHSGSASSGAVVGLYTPQ
eukprot:GCRY01006008.1.p1 GENE.GCRY01006008.1~~GCRY01006008.1.p1  ORF type:complete len:141 (+),score=44.08 GCRY01006008.1:2-424(+)